MTNPFLIGKNIYLRGLELSDAEGSYPNWLNNEENCRYLEHHVFPYTREMALEYIRTLPQKSDRIMLAVCDKENDRHIGNITLSSLSALHRSAEFTLLIADASMRGQGISKEASLLMFRHGFETMNLNRIWCGTMETNIPMQRLALSLGMVQEGIKRQEVYKNGRYYDTIQYSILKEEFDTLYPKEPV